MKCPECELDLRITNSRNVVENDDTPEKETKLFVIQSLSCMNRQCPNYEKVVETIRTEVPIG